MKTIEVAALIANITYKPWSNQDFRAIFNENTREVTVTFQRPDTFTGKIGTGVGGTAYIPPDWTAGDVARTVFGLWKALEEHECREGFRVYGVQIFSPHIELDAMLEAGRHIQGQPVLDPPPSRKWDADPEFKWQCTGCGHKMTESLRWCPKCGYTVYRPLYLTESEKARHARTD